jgi:hypothetical protein
MNSRVLRRKNPDKVKLLLVNDHPANLLSYEVVLGVDPRLSRRPLLTKHSTPCSRNDIGLIPIDVCMPEFSGLELAGHDS